MSEKILFSEGDQNYFDVDKDGKIVLKKKKIDLQNITTEELKALGIDPNLSAKEIAKKLKVSICLFIYLSDIFI